MAQKFMRGKDSTLVLYINGNKEDALDVKSWTVKCNVTTHNDGVCGESRDRLDKTINYYEISLDCFAATGSKIQKLLNYDAAIDASENPIIQFGLRVQEKDGGKRGFSTDGQSIVDDWEWAASGRTDNQMIKIPIRAQYVKELSL